MHAHAGIVPESPSYRFEQQPGALLCLGKPQLPCAYCSPAPRPTKRALPFSRYLQYRCDAKYVTSVYGVPLQVRRGPADIDSNLLVDLPKLALFASIRSVPVSLRLICKGLGVKTPSHAARPQRCRRCWRVAVLQPPA